MAHQTTLTSAEKVAGRAFRHQAQEDLTALMASDPPFYRQPNFIAYMRHECPGRREISTAIELKEVYVQSPAIAVLGDVESALAMAPADLVSSNRVVFFDSDKEELVGTLEYTVIPAGRFGFIYKEGKCKARECQRTVRSPAGRFVDAWDRPPIEGRVARSGK